MRRLLAHTIWAPGAIPESEGKTAREFKRVILPALDVALFLTGVLGALNVVPALNEALHDDFVDGLCLAFAGSAVLAFVGIAIPKLAIVEFVSKVLLGMGLVGFIATLFVVAIGATSTPGGDSRWYLIPLFFVPLGIVIWRSSQLAADWGTRAAERRHQRREALRQKRETTGVAR